MRQLLLILLALAVSAGCTTQAPPPHKLGAGVRNGPATEGTLADLLAVSGNADDGGVLKVAEQYAPAAEDNTNGVIKVEQRFGYSNMTGTTLVKSGSGFLHTVCVNLPAISGATIKVEDALTDTTPKIATITMSGTLTNVDPFCMLYDVSFSTGLNLVLSGTLDVTASYR